MDFNRIRYFAEYEEIKGNEIECQRCADTEADARASTLVYLLENKLIRRPRP